MNVTPAGANISYFVSLLCYQLQVTHIHMHTHTKRTHTLSVVSFCLSQNNNSHPAYLQFLFGKLFRFSNIKNAMMLNESANTIPDLNVTGVCSVKERKSIQVRRRLLLRQEKTHVAVQLPSSSSTKWVRDNVLKKKPTPTEIEKVIFTQCSLGSFTPSCMQSYFFVFAPQPSFHHHSCTPFNNATTPPSAALQLLRESHRIFSCKVLGNQHQNKEGVTIVFTSAWQSYWTKSIILHQK